MVVFVLEVIFEGLQFGLDRVLKYKQFVLVRGESVSVLAQRIGVLE